MLLVAVVVVMLGLWRDLFPCDPTERVALAEFQHYGGREAGEDLNVAGNELSRFTLGPSNTNGACRVMYSASASQEQVSAYYEELLAEHGWAVERSPVRAADEPPRMDGSRDDLRYVVHYFGEPGPRASDVTVVSVEVFRA